MAQSSHTVFLVNPASANGSTGRRWPELARRAAAAGLEGATLFSEREGHLAELAREAALGGAELLVVVGGDGSVNEVANGLAGLGRQPDVAIVPRGTGWDFSRTFAIPRIRARPDSTVSPLNGESKSTSSDDLSPCRPIAFRSAAKTSSFLLRSLSR